MRLLLTSAIVLLLFACLMYSCDKGCDLVCTGEYEYLDEEECVCKKDLETMCSNGVKDEYEADIDCGGICLNVGKECLCTEAKGGEWCHLLTESNSKTWAFEHRISTEGDTMITNRATSSIPSSIWVSGYWCPKELVLKVDGTLRNIWLAVADANRYGTWEVDVEDSVLTCVMDAAIGIQAFDKSIFLYGHHESKIIKLNEDTLLLFHEAAEVDDYNAALRGWFDRDNYTLFVKGPYCCPWQM
jgi:hypothetical protein